MPEKTTQKEHGKKTAPPSEKEVQPEVVIQIPLAELHPFPNRKIKPRSSYIVGGVIVTTKIKFRLGGLPAHPRNQDISSEKKKCPFFVPKIRCRQEEHNA